MIEVKVHSSSSDTVYVVLVTDPNCPEEAVCECRGYEYGGTCKHQQQAIDSFCYWIESDPEVQTKSEHKNRICPKCGGETEYVMEYE